MSVTSEEHTVRRDGLGGESREDQQPQRRRSASIEIVLAAEQGCRSWETRRFCGPWGCQFSPERDSAPPYNVLTPPIPLSGRDR